MSDTTTALITSIVTLIAVIINSGMLKRTKRKVTEVQEKIEIIDDKVKDIKDGN